MCKVARVQLTNGIEVTSVITSDGNNLREHSVALKLNGRVEDFTSVSYQVVRGTLDTVVVKTAASRWLINLP